MKGQGSVPEYFYEGTDYPLMDRVLDYWGIHTYHIISNPETKGAKIPPHIDCLAKFLSPDTILMLRYPSSNPLSERTEAAATYFGRQISCYGTPYKVLRLDVQDKEPYIHHVPLLDRPPVAEGFPIRAEIEAFSGTEFVDGTPIVLWRTEPEARFMHWSHRSLVTLYLFPILATATILSGQCFGPTCDG